jgi:hypothetical protein
MHNFISIPIQHIPILFLFYLPSTLNDLASNNGAALAPQYVKIINCEGDLSHPLRGLNLSRVSGLQSEQKAVSQLRPTSECLPVSVANLPEPQSLNTESKRPEDYSTVPQTESQPQLRPLLPVQDRILVCVLPSGTQLANGLRHLSTCAILAHAMGRTLLFDPTLSMSADFFRFYQSLSFTANIAWACKPAPGQCTGYRCCCAPLSSTITEKTLKVQHIQIRSSI